MARHSQTEIAVLGGLSVEPMTGYGLRAAIAETLGYFWSESFGQIYPTLAHLEKEGLVRREAPGKTSGSVFEITAKGLARLRSLLAEPIVSALPRNGLLLRLFFGRLLERGECESMLRTAFDHAQAQLALFGHIREELERGESNPNTPFWQITLAAGQHHARAEAAWAQEALGILYSIEVN